MEQRNITSSQHPQSSETIEVVSNLGACYVIDNNPENKHAGFVVTPDEKTEDSIAQEIDSKSDNDNTKDKEINVMSDNQPEDDSNGGHSETLQDNFKDDVVEGLDMISKKKLEDSIDVRSSVTLNLTSDDRHSMIMMSNQIADVKPDVRIDDFSPTYSIDNQSGYEGDVDTIKDGESSGSLTDSDSETKKNLAEKSKSVIQKAIARLDSITEEIAEVDADERSGKEDSSDEPGSSCTDTMVSEYDSTDLEKDTNIPKDILYKLLGKENKREQRRCSKNTKRKLSSEDG